MVNNDYTLLFKRIKEICGTRAAFAEAMGLSERSVSLKLNNKREWKQSEMLKACEVLEADTAVIPKLFFSTSEKHPGKK